MSMMPPLSLENFMIEREYISAEEIERILELPNGTFDVRNAQETVSMRGYRPITEASKVRVPLKAFMERYPQYNYSMVRRYIKNGYIDIKKPNYAS